MTDPADASKPWYLSRTILSAVGIIAVALLNLAGVAANAEDVPAIAEVAGGFLTAILGGVAIWGRVVARERIG